VAVAEEEIVGKSQKLPRDQQREVIDLLNHWHRKILPYQLAAA
jgi:hypothetical protein